MILSLLVLERSVEVKPQLMQMSGWKMSPIHVTGPAKANMLPKKQHQKTCPDSSASQKLKLVTLLDLCVSSLHRGHANLFFQTSALQYQSAVPAREKNQKGMHMKIVAHISKLALFDCLTKP